jgi:hypothetical protein
VFGTLARAAGHHVLVALAAALGVVRGSESVLQALDLLEDEAVVVERRERVHVLLVDRLEGRPLLQESIGQVVEARRRLGGGLARIRAALWCRRDRFSLDAPSSLEAIARLRVGGVRNEEGGAEQQEAERRRSGGSGVHGEPRVEGTQGGSVRSGDSVVLAITPVEQCAASLACTAPASKRRSQRVEGRGITGILAPLR